METARTIFVTGATGNQGGAVARSLVQQGFKVKALTRNPKTAAAQELTKLGIQVVQGDLNQPQTYSHHLQNVDGIFSVQTFTNGIEAEVKQGIGLANLAQEFNIKQFIYSSVVGADLPTGIPHWESKGQIENHIRTLHLPATIIRPASFYENFLVPQVKSRLQKGKLVSPIGKNVVQQFIGTKDIGRTTAYLFSNPAKYAGQTLTLAAEELDMVKVAKMFSEVLGKEIKYQKLPGLITRLVMGKNLYKMFKWINEHGGVFKDNNQEIKRDLPPTMPLQQWISQHF